MGEPKARQHRRTRKHESLVVRGKRSMKNVQRISRSQELIAENARLLTEHLREQAANQPIEGTPPESAKS